MACERWRELISAQLDGEDDPADRSRVDDHLAGCAGCRRWLEQAAMVNRLTRTSAARPVPDLTEVIMAGVPDAASSRRVPSGLLYVALVVVGAVQLILGLTQVGGGAFGAHVHTGLTATPGHLWHESAAWNVAVGAGFLFIGLRRSRPSGLVPMLTAFVGMLLLLSVNDLSAGRVNATRLVTHAFVLAGYLLVVALTRVTTDPAEPPGARRSGGHGWRARFEDDQAGETAPPAPKLRLVPRRPMTARYDQRRAA
ncbi:MAG TPA: zf-HC2 domain-containing protein [Actinoplanes sp.]|nr:zf-HC2 domain-containing protein [Actinoplanes sp.]